MTTETACALCGTTNAKRERVGCSPSWCCADKYECGKRRGRASSLTEIASLRAQLAAAAARYERAVADADEVRGRLGRGILFDGGDCVIVERVSPERWVVANEHFQRLHPSGAWVSAPDDDYENDDAWLPWESASFPTADAAFAALAAARKEVP